jgi:glycine betaine/proline transport system substrate-binding protein
VSGAPPSSAAGETITPGRAHWSAGYFQAALYAALIDELGYDVDDPADHEYPPSEAYAAMAEGAIDFWPNGWYPQHEVWHDEVLAGGDRVGDRLVVIGNELDDAGLQGFVITKSVADEHGISSLAQLNGDPDLAALFDLDDDGLADIFGCPEDWTCVRVIDEMITHNRWANVAQTSDGFPGMFQASLDRVRAGEPAIQYVWSPSGYLSQLVPGENVLWLSMGGEEYVLDGTSASGLDYAQYGPVPLGESCTEEMCWPGWLVEDIRVTANRAFNETHPDVAALFEVVQLEPGDIFAQNARYDAGENSEADVQRHAAEWIDEHRALVDRWLDAARAAGG